MTQTDLQQILSELATAQTALRRSSTAFDQTIAGLQATYDAFDRGFESIRATLAAVSIANKEQGAAIDGVINATNRALELLETNGKH